MLHKRPELLRVMTGFSDGYYALDRSEHPLRTLFLPL